MTALYGSKLIRKSITIILGSALLVLDTAIIDLHNTINSCSWAEKSKTYSLEQLRELQLCRPSQRVDIEPTSGPHIFMTTSVAGERTSRLQARLWKVEGRVGHYFTEHKH